MQPLFRNGETNALTRTDLLFAIKLATIIPKIHATRHIFVSES